MIIFWFLLGYWAIALTWLLSIFVAACMAVWRIKDRTDDEQTEMLINSVNQHMGGAHIDKDLYDYITKTKEGTKEGWGNMLMSCALWPIFAKQLIAGFNALKDIG